MRARVLVITLEKGGDLTKQPTFSGRSIPVDLNVLIEKIYLAPQVKEWKVKLLKKILCKYKMDIPVCQSALDDVPY
jgi:hypothetical protein